jgi:alanine racemase
MPGRPAREVTARASPAALHIDTGMARLGLPPEELSQLRDDPSRLDGIDLRCIMSHRRARTHQNTH